MPWDRTKNGSGLATADGRWRRRHEEHPTVATAVPMLLRSSTPVVNIKCKGPLTTITVRTADLLAAAARPPLRVVPVKVVRSVPKAPPARAPKAVDGRVLERFW